MADRRGFVYHRRDVAGDRIDDTNREATDGNTNLPRQGLPIEGGSDRSHEPQIAASTATVESFTQMMAAVTQLIQSSQSQPQASGVSGTQMDKYLKLFQDMRPPLFTGLGEPAEAEDWLLRVEKILDGMLCPSERRVSLAAFALDGEAERWWKNQLTERFVGRHITTITWEEFLKVFRDWYVPISARRQMQDRFIRLVQGDRSINQYENEFTMLSRYAPQLIPDAAEKCHRFLSGLKDSIRQPLIPLGIEDYAVLVDRARRIEIDNQAVQKRREFQKRRSSDFQKGNTLTPDFRESADKRPKTSESENSSNAILCAKCGKNHRGECLSGSNECFWCHQPGHIAKYCPKALADKKTSGAYTQRAGKQIMQAPSAPASASASASNQVPARSNVQPRVYAITQQEAKESPDDITGDRPQR